MKIKFRRFEIGLFHWNLPFNLFSLSPRQNEYGIYATLGYLFEFWIAIDFNKYDNEGFLIENGSAKCIQKHISNQ